MEITYTTEVIGDTGQAPGVIGLIVHDSRASQYVAITAANVAGKKCRELATGEPIGTSIALRPERYFRARLRPAWTLLTPVALGKHVRVGEGRIKAKAGPVYPALEADPRSFTGETVFVHLRNRDPMEAMLVSSRSSFAMPVSDADGPVFFQGAIELFFLGEQERARRGDAGSVVTSTDGAVLGIVVSAVGTSTFVAPVSPLLEQMEGCVPLSASLIKRRNKLAHAEPIEPVSDEKPMDNPPDEVQRDWRRAVEEGDEAAQLKVGKNMSKEIFA
jgi:hypothetical protein